MASDAPFGVNVVSKNGYISASSGKTVPTVEDGEKTDVSEDEVEIRVYSRRWYIVAVLSLLVFSNSMSRIAFGPVAYTSAIFYESEISVINWFALVYMIVGIPCGLVVTWVMDRIGLRNSLLFASWLHSVGCILRVASAIVSVPNNGKLALVFVGHIMSAIAQPFLMFAPTKVAAVWFPDNQRAIANTIVTTSNPLGIMAANILSPVIVRRPDDLITMLAIYAIPAVIGALLATFGIRSSYPPLPPSASAEKNPVPFWNGVKQLMTNVQYWVIFVSVGGGIGIYTALTVFLEQILCPWGYTDFFAGVVCGSCLVIAGVVGALIAGIIADKTKQFSLVSKISYVFCIGAVAFFTFFQNRQNQRILIALSCALIGFFGMPLLPLGNELVVETTYPVEIATSTGLVFLSGQLQGMLLVLVLQSVATPVATEFENVTRCRAGEGSTPSGIWDKPIKIRDMTTPCHVFLGYSAFICLVFVLFYRTANKRINMEREAAEKKMREPNTKEVKRQLSCTSLSKSVEEDDTVPAMDAFASADQWTSDLESTSIESENNHDKLSSKENIVQRTTADPDAKTDNNLSSLLP